MTDCVVRRLGRMPYPEGQDLQRRLVGERIRGLIPDTLLLLEHEPVYTLGRSGRWGNLLLDPQRLARLGASAVETDRGGDITFHGPGQLVGYPIFDLNALKRDVKWYLEQVEESVVRAVAEFGIRAARSTGHTGVWVGDRKLCALGVRVQRWVTSHGFALNVNTDLEYFSLIIPCGLPDKGVTSMAEILARHVDFERVCEAVARNFGSVFDRRVTYEEPIAAERSQGEQTAAQVRTDADERT